MNGVKTKEDFERANNIFHQEFGEAPPQMEYDPRAVQVLKDSAIRVRDQMYQEHARAMEGVARARAADTASYHSESIKLRKAEEDRKVEHDRVLAKNGGQDVGAPSKGEVDAARDIIEGSGKAKGLDDTSSRSAAFDLASRARVLRRQNQGLSAGEAHQRALVEQIEDGYYATKKGGVFSGDRATYRNGTSVEGALPAPKDLKTLKPQKYYQTPKGPLLYLGDGKWQVPKQGASSEAGAAPDSEDDMEEEEE